MSSPASWAASWKSSARAALSWARVHSEQYGAAEDFFDGNGLHIHVPAGAIPKDGPSAGVTMTTAMVSVATQRKVRRDVAMTGEITLRGRVLPVGGIKDKLLAAHRAGIATFIMPHKNRRDLHDIDADVLQSVQVITVDNVTEVLEHALLPARRTAPAVGRLPLPLSAGREREHPHGVMEPLGDLVELHIVVDPFYDENCYVLRRRDSDRCLVVDPGLQAEEALRVMEDLEAAMRSHPAHPWSRGPRQRRAPPDGGPRSARRPSMRRTAGCSTS